MAKFKIVEITEWEKDTWMMEGDASHHGWNPVDKRLVEEEEEKAEGWNKGLPFECEAESLEDAIQEYNDTYCQFDYLKAVEVEVEEE